MADENKSNQPDRRTALKAGAAAVLAGKLQLDVSSFASLIPKLLSGTKDFMLANDVWFRGYTTERKTSYLNRLHKRGAKPGNAELLEFLREEKLQLLSHISETAKQIIIRLNYLSDWQKLPATFLREQETAHNIILDNHNRALSALIDKTNSEMQEEYVPMSIFAGRHQDCSSLWGMLQVQSNRVLQRNPKALEALRKTTLAEHRKSHAALCKKYNLPDEFSSIFDAFFLGNTDGGNFFVQPAPAEIIAKIQHESPWKTFENSVRKSIDEFTRDFKVALRQAGLGTKEADEFETEAKQLLHEKLDRKLPEKVVKNSPKETMSHTPHSGDMLRYVDAVNDASAWGGWESRLEETRKKLRKTEFNI